MALYLLDTNIFIESFKVSYPIDVVPNFWNKFKELAEKGTILSIDKVKNEIKRHDDNLNKWCKDNLPENFFKKIFFCNTFLFIFVFKILRSFMNY